jgi:hypothetical protein
MVEEWRHSECTGDSPSTTEAQLNCASAEARPSAPSRDGIGDAEIGQAIGGRRIARLLASCGPTTIGFRVGAVIVDTIQRICWRGLHAHVGEKLNKGCLPLRADRDASAAVIAVLRRPWIIAAALHRPPCPVFGRVGASVCAGGTRSAFPVTATGIDGATSQHSDIEILNRAAVAPAAPQVQGTVIGEYRQVMHAPMGQVLSHRMSVSQHAG